MKNKRLLLVQPLYSIVIYTFLSLLCLLCCFLPQLLKWENSKVLLKIIYYFIFTSGTILFLIISILCIEFAFIDDQKIVIKNIFGEIVKVEWNECCSISKERILIIFKYDINKLDFYVLTQGYENYTFIQAQKSCATEALLDVFLSQVFKTGFTFPDLKIQIEK